MNDIINKNFDQRMILIYPHTHYSNADGGIMVMYYLAALLKKKNINVKIYKTSIDESDINNELFGDYTNDFDRENTIVIYCEGTINNPLNAKYAIRWILSELGKNCDKTRYLSWGYQDLCYFFLSEKKIKDNLEKLNKVYKFLTLIYLKPNFFLNLNKPRKSYCHIYKKYYYHKNFISFHPENSIEIKYSNFDDLLDIFNTYEYFICYDPSSFLIYIAGLCGCIPILHKVENVSKEEYFTGMSDSNSCFYIYYLNNSYNDYPGIAYGLEDLENAKRTIHLLPDFLKNQIEYINTNSLDNFIEDIKNFQNNNNTIKNAFVNV
jgi:hypothetical protein